MSVIDDLHRAREAFERREWVAAYRALTDLDDGDLHADDFAALAITAFLLGHHNEASRHCSAPTRPRPTRATPWERSARRTGSRSSSGKAGRP